MTDWSKQRMWEEINEGDEIPVVSIPLTVARLVMFAGASRDFSQTHHNRDVAKQTGAPDMYANNPFIQAWWERAVREYIGLDGRITKLGPLRMRRFNVVGDTAHTHGRVVKKWSQDGVHFVELEMWTETSEGVSAGPGPVIVTLPSESRNA